MSETTKRGGARKSMVRNAPVPPVTAKQQVPSDLTKGNTPDTVFKVSLTPSGGDKQEDSTAVTPQNSETVLSGENNQEVNKSGTEGEANDLIMDLFQSTKTSSSVSFVQPTAQKVVGTRYLFNAIHRMNRTDNQSRHMFHVFFLKTGYIITVGLNGSNVRRSAYYGRLLNEKFYKDGHPAVKQLYVKWFFNLRNENDETKTYTFPVERVKFDHETREKYVDVFDEKTKVFVSQPSDYNKTVALKNNKEAKEEYGFLFAATIQELMDEYKGRAGSGDGKPKQRRINNVYHYVVHDHIKDENMVVGDFLTVFDTLQVMQESLGLPDVYILNDEKYRMHLRLFFGNDDDFIERIRHRHLGGGKEPYFNVGNPLPPSNGGSGSGEGGSPAGGTLEERRKRLQF